MLTTVEAVLGNSLPELSIPAVPPHTLRAGLALKGQPSSTERKWIREISPSVSCRYPQ